MFCTHCGKAMPEGAEFCPYCGKSAHMDGQQPNYGYQQPNYGYQQPFQHDTGSAGWGVLGFFIPLVGLILYLVWQNERPRDAKMAGKGALIGVIVWVSFSILMAIISVIAMAAAFSSYSLNAVMLPLLTILK